MPRHRQLLALLLVAVYTAVSTFGMSFVICVEGDGSQNVEPVGAACCEPDDVSIHGVSIYAVASDEDSLVAADANGGDCGDCQAHLPAIDVDATKVDEAQPDVASPVRLPPPAFLAVDVWPHAGLARPMCRTITPQPRPPPARICLRSVVFLC